jgi:manganese/iron transport system permease protein
MIDLVFWAPVLVAGCIAGASTGMIGTYIVGMRVPFVGVCISHTALAGAVFGSLCGCTGPWLLLPAMLGASGGAIIVGLVSGRRQTADDNIAIGVLFSASMGLAFLGIGLFGILGRSDNEVRNLLWGSLMFCRWRDVIIMAAMGAVALLFVLAFGKELLALMFSREHAAAAGIHTTLIWSGFLVVTAGILTVNFQTVGGLMIYSLMTNPAVAAFVLVRGCRRSLWLSTFLGAGCSLLGFLASALTDLPTGAMIVLVSSGLVALAHAWSRWRGGRGEPRGRQSGELRPSRAE